MTPDDARFLTLTAEAAQSVIDELDAPSGFVSRQMAGRCASGCERDRGSRYHAVADAAASHSAALCGTKPGRRSCGWRDPSECAISCPRCLKKLAKLSGAATADEPPAEDTFSGNADADEPYQSAGEMWAQRCRGPL